MEKDIILNIASPLQSWAGYYVDKTRIDTSRQPSERAIRGLISASFGVHRGSDVPEIIQSSEISVKTVNHGRIIKDFHTIGSQNSVREGAKPHNSEFFEKIGRILVRGKQLTSKNSITATPIISNRSYLGDAQFLVSIKGRDKSETEEILFNLLNPKWDLYMGKKAFAPVFPFNLGLFDEKDSFENALDMLQNIQKKSVGEYNEKITLDLGGVND